MAHVEFLEQLFKAHLADLKSISAEEIDIFICPICMNEFPLEGIYEKKVDDGHVWPDYLRSKSVSGLATSHRVLLCKDCNSKAGSLGDYQMQLREQIIDGEKTGQFYSERRTEIIQAPGQKPISLKATINKTGELNAQIIFQKNKKRDQWERNNPSEQQRFLSLIEKDETFSVIVYPPNKTNALLARTGWLTSAYLLAFYAFGYRYILQESLDPVRRHIKDSFEKDLLEFPQTDVINVRADETDFFNDPQIRIEIPLDGKTPVHVEVSFLDCHVTLPFPGIPDNFSRVISSKMKDIESRLPQLVEQDASIRIPITCTKSDGHSCIWDYVLWGK